jgi:hypothetical protein
MAVSRSGLCRALGWSALWWSAPIWFGSLASAQTVGAGAAPLLSGYAVGGPAGYSAFFGGQSALWFAGGGAEVIGPHGLGAGGELGVFFDTSGAILFTPSIDAVYRPRRRQGPIVPFIAGGYTRLLGVESAFDGWNAGGGLTWWSDGRTGVRIEFRDHIRADRERWAHYWTIRAGISFR